MSLHDRLTATEVARTTRAERALRGIEQLRRSALAIEGDLAEALGRTSPGLRESAYNLAHYLAVRRHDVRELQRDLGALGLSSLGRMEAHVMASLNAVLEMLMLVLGQPAPQGLLSPPIGFDTGDAVLAGHAVAILGERPAGRNTRIMVTMPSEAATDEPLIRDLLDRGMDVMRINCAHDDAAVWEKMVANLRRAEKATGRRCKLSFDLAGPKLRTGPIAAAPAVIKWRPGRDALGRTVAPARVCFTTTAHAQAPTAIVVPVRGDLPRQARPGDSVHLVDARGRRRSLRVVEADADGCLCEGDATAYVVPSTPLRLKRHGRLVADGEVADELPPVEGAIVLEPGDRLDLLPGDAVGHDASHDDDGVLVAPASIGCALAEVFAAVRPGQRVFFDDGRIAGIIEEACGERVRIEITHAAGGCAKLRGEKGINLPDTELQLPALSAQDLQDLAFAARHGDMVALSFVQRTEDVEQLIAELDRLGAADRGVVLKVETQQAFARLPSLLLAAMRHPSIAVMVARGDLGVEVGFERLSEVQEEILWMCEAAHVPVIWATQVLDSLAKGGTPSRAEVTDAAMASRAECVMLNKGPYILQTVDFLRDVLSRMASHQQKKSSLLRKLSISNVKAPSPGAHAAAK